MIKDQYGRFMQHYHLYPALGIPPGGHLPKEGFAPREIGGALFKCEPAKEPRVYNGHRVKVSKHRLFVRCDICDRWLPFGRWSQHIKGKEHKEGGKEIR